MDITCTAAGCLRRRANGSYCWAHYSRMRRHGYLERPPLTCVSCGTSFLKVAASGPTPKYCSECASRRGRKPVYRGIRACLCCGVPVEPGSGSRPRRFCSSNCSSLHARSGGESRGIIDCARCSSPIDLRERVNGRLRPKSTLMCEHCRRAPKYYELSAQQLAERDGFGCGICGKVVDFSIPCPADMSPSVDHIIPWSRNGSHRAMNLQLAHRICNVRKGIAM